MTANDLRQWRLSLGLPQWLAAKALGRSLRSYQALEQGEAKVTHETDLACAALARGLRPWSEPVAESRTSEKEHLENA